MTSAIVVYSLKPHITMNTPPKINLTTYPLIRHHRSFVSFWWIQNRWRLNGAYIYPTLGEGDLKRHCCFLFITLKNGCIKPFLTPISLTVFVWLRPGPAPGWHLDYIDVKDEIMDKTFRFPCDRWLAKNDDDGQIIRELACANNDYLDLNEKTSEARTHITL